MPLLAIPARAEILEDLWNQYIVKSPTYQPPANASKHKTSNAPGLIIGKAQGEADSAFDYKWKYRERAFEMHFEKASDLSHSIYSLALHTRDISPKLPKEKFFKGVPGFHYSTEQIVTWLNDPEKMPLSTEEKQFVAQLQQGGVVSLQAGRYVGSDSIDHVLGAAPGKKRSFAFNLRHERLHVFWDEDPQFRTRYQAEWLGLEEAEKLSARQNELRNYAQGNEQQLVEEWAIYKAEASNMSLE